MVEDAAVTAADIARLAGVGRAAVSNWRRRFDNFPRPVGGTDTSPTFKLADVHDWLRDQGKLAALSARELVWQRLEAAAAGRPVADVLAAAGAHLAHRRGRIRLDQSTLRLLHEFAAEEGPEPAFEQLCDRFAEANSRQLAVTPPELARLMVALARPLGGVVLDPACGTGTILRTAGVGGSQPRLYGQESDPALAELAATRLAFGAAGTTIRTGDSLREDAFADFVADTVLCNPPFNDRNWGYEDLAYDPRWSYGMPPKGESELAWVQHCLAHLRPGGTAVVLMPPTVASRRSGRSIRAELVRRGTLSAVIALPAGAAPPLGLPLHLWMLRKPTEPVLDAGVLLVDATAGEPSRLEDLGWPLVTKRVLTAAADRVAGEPAPGVHKVVPAIELLDDDVDLTPARHLRPVADTSGLGASRQSLAALLAELPACLPEVVAVDDGVDQRATTSLAALARSGAVVLRQQTVALNTSDDGTGQPVLTARDVVTGTGPSTRLADDAEPADLIVLRVGDVVVPVIAPRPTALVVREGGAVLGTQLLLVRADLEHLDPWFLAGFLRSRDMVRHSSSLSGTHRFDVRRVEVPRLALADQRRYGDTFRRLAEFESTLSRAAALGREVAQSMTDGLALGVLAPGEQPGE